MNSRRVSAHSNDKRLYELRLAIACYLVDDNVFIPAIYHDHILCAYDNSNLPWKAEQAAAFTLLAAFNGNALKLNELTYPGQVALVWAENHIEKHNRQSRLSRKTEGMYRFIE